MEFRILGTLEVFDGSSLVDVGAAAKKTVLAILLLHPNQVVSVDRLVDDLWGDRAPPGARATLQSYISTLRKALEPDVVGGRYRLLVTRASGYLLQLEGPDQLDAARFEALAASGRQALARGDAAGAAAIFREALGLWRGVALADFAYAPFAQAEATRLEEARLAVLEDRIEADLRVGRHGELVGELEALVAAHPLRERLWGQLMVALYRCGRQAEAVRAFQRLREELGELGMEPSPELQRLEGAILRQEDWLEAPGPGRGEAVVVEERPVLRVAPHLPTPISSFVGRSWELREVGKLVKRERLVTLTGAGGCGKTRLALAVAEGLVEAYPGGVWFADLGPVGDASLVPQAVAETLGAGEEPGRAVPDTLVDVLHPMAALLVLDNCEHVTEACAKLADVLLRACGSLRILATSREVLGIPGEAIFRVPSLSVPPQASPPDGLLEYESVRLFMERATAVQPKLELSDESAAAVASICRRLDGIPLALELAAARAAVLTPDHIAARLDDRFRLLVGGSRAALPRHQTLLATLDWSYNLLSPAEQTLLRRLSVCAGSFTLEAAEVIGSGPKEDQDEVFDLLVQLVDKSLVVMEPESGGARYRMLETTRHYARDKLGQAGEGDEVARRHRDFYLAVAEQAEPQLWGSDDPQVSGADAGRVLDRLQADHGNFHAALQWSLDAGGDDAGLRLASALYPFWLMRSLYREGRQWMEALLEQPSDITGARSAVARRAAGLATNMGDRDAARRLADFALDLARQCEDAHHLGRALGAVALLAIERGELTRSRSLLEESLVLARAQGDRRYVAESLVWLGWVEHYEARYAEARARAEEALAEGGSDSLWHRSQFLYLLSSIEEAQADYGAAALHLQELQSLSAAINDPVWAIAALGGLGSLAAAEGRRADARSAYEEALALAQDSPHQGVRVSSLQGLGELASAEGDHAAACARLEEALRVARQVGDVDLVVGTLNGLGRARAASGEALAGRSAYEEALAIGHAAGMPRHVATTLEGLAEVDALVGRPQRATRLWAAAHTLRERIGAPLAPVAERAQAEEAAEVRPVLGDDDFAAAWTEGCALDLNDAVALATAEED